MKDMPDSSKTGQNSFFVTLFCYAYIFYYGIKGYKPAIVAEDDGTSDIDAEPEAV